MMPGPQSPELAKKTRAIMALREMLAMRLTSRNISVALPILKELCDAEKGMQSRAEQLLEEERRALLAAEPDDPMPPGVGEKMQAEMQRYNEKQARAWENLVEAIGPEKTNGIRRLLGDCGGCGAREDPPPTSGCAVFARSSLRVRVILAPATATSQVLRAETPCRPKASGLMACMEWQAARQLPSVDCTTPRIHASRWLAAKGPHVQDVGLVVVVTLMLFALRNDVVRFLLPR
jgi:hypothetical protein